MSGRLGIAIGATDVRAVCVKAGRITWHDTRRVDGLEQIGPALQGLLASRPKGTGSRVGVAIGPGWVQVKKILGIPRLRSAALATQLVRENQRAFFRSAGRGEMLVEARLEPDDAAWGAAFDGAVLPAVVTALRGVRLRPRTLVPSVVAMITVWSDRILVLRDGDHVLRLAGERGRLRLVERLAAQPIDETEIAPTLEGLDTETWHYADAYAAAVCPARAPFAWRPTRESRARGLKLAANVSALSLIAAGFGFCLVGPAVRQTRFLRSARLELARNHAAMSELSRIESELRAVNGRLVRIERFRARQGSITRLVAALSDAIPESTAILNVRVDSVEGAFTAISPSIAGVLPSVGEVASFRSVRLMGSITTETIGGAHLQRGAFRFRRPDVGLVAQRRVR